VCALHEQFTHLLKVLEKPQICKIISSLQELINKCFFSRGCKSLMRGVMPEALASGKLVYREVCSEGSQLAKVCTDGQVLQD
jgi:hypothetical protein